jgi:hypothetical protein
MLLADMRIIIYLKRKVAWLIYIGSHDVSTRKACKKFLPEVQSTHRRIKQANS